MTGTTTAQAQWVEAELWLLPRTMSEQELLSLLAPVAAARQLQLGARDAVISADTSGLSIRFRLLTETKALKTWLKREPAKSAGKTMAVQIDYAVQPDYRGEQHEYANASGQVIYRKPLLVALLSKQVEQIAGAAFVNLYRWPRFR